jgi:hypothetical protein
MWDARGEAQRAMFDTDDGLAGEKKRMDAWMCAHDIGETRQARQALSS